MALARTHSVALVGVQGHLVEVEADIANGLVGMVLVGLPDTALREARDRIRSAIVNSGEQWPQRRMPVGGNGDRDRAGRERRKRVGGRRLRRRRRLPRQRRGSRGRPSAVPRPASLPGAVNPPLSQACPADSPGGRFHSR